MRLVLDVFTVPPFGENTYLVGDADAGEAVVVDPGGRVDEIIHIAGRRGVRIVGIYGTHAHIDHVSGVAELKEKTGAPYWLHPDAEATLAGGPAQAAQYGMPPYAVPTVDHPLDAGDVLAVGGLTFSVRYTPGHAAGHVTLVSNPVDYDGDFRPLVFCGDVIFQDSIGRTDLNGGDFDVLMTSIEQQILTLPREAILFSGHGPATTVNQEHRFNPFVRDWLSQRPPSTPQAD